MKKELYSLLSSFIPTFQFNAPEDNEEIPVCIFYLFDERYQEVWGDKQIGREKHFTVKIYNEIDDDVLNNQIEQAIIQTFPNCSLVTKRERKEDGLFLCEFDFIKR